MPRPPPPLRRPEGLSLIEVLLAGVILVVAMFPLYDMFATSTRSGVASTERLLATEAAATLMEALKAIPSRRLPVTSPTGRPGWRDTEVANQVMAPPGGSLDAVQDLGPRIPELPDTIDSPFSSQ
jgi:Tfp pilus assembly protein PilV